MNKAALLVSGSILLTACGGGGGSGSGAPAVDPNPPANVLSLEFSDSLFPPNTSNQKSGIPDNEFDPGDRLAIVWSATASDAASSVLYGSKVYISADTSLDPATDPLLFSIDCKIQDTNSEYSCGQFASIQCQHKGDNTFDCRTLPLDGPNGFKDLVVDLNAFFTSVPMSATIFYEICRKDDSAVCDDDSTSIVLR